MQRPAESDIKMSDEQKLRVMALKSIGKTKKVFIVDENDIQLSMYVLQSCHTPGLNIR